MKVGCTSHFSSLWGKYSNIFSGSEFSYKVFNMLPKFIEPLCLFQVWHLKYLRTFQVAISQYKHQISPRRTSPFNSFNLDVVWSSDLHWGGIKRSWLMTSHKFLWKWLSTSHLTKVITSPIVSFYHRLSLISVSALHHIEISRASTTSPFPTFLKPLWNIYVKSALCVTD